VRLHDALAEQSNSPFRSAIVKLIEIVDEENAVLEGRRVVSHAGFTERKNHALRELMAIQRASGSTPLCDPCDSLLSRLSDGLKRNATLLKLHIAAVGEVSDIIISGLHAAESDGTYSRNRT